MTLPQLFYLPDVLAVVVGAEHIELDVDRVARVAVLGDDGIGAHLATENWIDGQISNISSHFL